MGRQHPLEPVVARMARQSAGRLVHVLGQAFLRDHIDIRGAEQVLIKRDQTMVFEMLGPEAEEAEIGIAGKELLGAHGSAAREILHVDRGQHPALMADGNQDARVRRDLLQALGIDVAADAAEERMPRHDLG